MTVVECSRCHRPLKNPLWQAVGMGRRCAERLGLMLQRPRLVAVEVTVKRRTEENEDQMELPFEEVAGE